MREFEPPKRIQIAVKNLFIGMAYVLTLTLILSISYYYKPYEFFNEHISNLGSITAGNETSRILMNIGFGFNSFLMIIVSVIYFWKRNSDVLTK